MTWALTIIHCDLLGCKGWWWSRCKPAKDIYSYSCFLVIYFQKHNCLDCNFPFFKHSSGDIVIFIFGQNNRPNFSSQTMFLQGFIQLDQNVWLLERIYTTSLHQFSIKAWSDPIKIRFLKGIDMLKQIFQHVSKA